MVDHTHDFDNVSCCHVPKGPNPAPLWKRYDWILWISLAIVGGSYILHFFYAHDHESLMGRFTGASFELVNTMWWGVIAGALIMGLLSKVPRHFVTAALGSESGLRGIVRATIAGLLFDVCSHGITMVGAKLYERGATLGQVMAFLIASPWNSISLTIILISLIGLKYTLLFTALTVVIGIASGMIFDALVVRGILPENPNKQAEVGENFHFWGEAKKGLKNVKWTPRLFIGAVRDGFKESVMLVRWLLFGIVITAVMRVVFTPDALYETLFGPTFMGLLVTLVAATIIEVCSEGAVPIAGDIFRRAGAAGNAFAFLMAGVSTNITTLLVLRQATGSWRTTLFLPLVTVPQVIVLGWLLNVFG
ncbi:MAG: permease [Alphaproteobacteria bacterium]|nr:permease [Alphaproteobacteria bacterium]